MFALLTSRQANVPARYVAVTATAARPFPGVLMLLILPVLNLAQGCIRVNALCPFEALLSIRRLLEGRRYDQIHRPDPLHCCH